MVSPLVFGAIASSGLLLGALIGAYLDVPPLVVGSTLAFASGALITALAFDLFEPAFGTAGPWLAGGGLFLGVIVFTAVDWVLEERVGGEESAGFALLASVTLDGVPENLALGVTLIGGESPLALLAAIFASNFPEALDGAAFIVGEDHSELYAVGLWTATGAILAAAVVAGHALFTGVGENVLAFVRAFAGGAVLASIADEILPDAYERGGPLISLSTAAGFFLTFLLI